MMSLLKHEKKDTDYFQLSNGNNTVYLAFTPYLLRKYKLYYISLYADFVIDIDYVTPELDNLMKTFVKNKHKFKKLVKTLKIDNKIKKKLLTMKKEPHGAGYYFGRLFDTLGYNGSNENVETLLNDSFGWNEIGFYEDIDLKYLKEIKVNQCDENTVKQLLEKYNLSNIGVSIKNELYP